MKIAVHTGCTINLEKRYTAHLNGTASKYTRSFKPFQNDKLLKYGSEWFFGWEYQKCIL